MKIEEQVLSIEQMKYLQELGVDTSDASMCWVAGEDTEKPMPQKARGKEETL